MPDSTTIAALRNSGRKRLEHSSASPDRDVDMLLTDLLGLSRAQLYTHDTQILSPEQLNALEASLIRLEQGEPLPYVRGHVEFWSMSLRVTPEVLIPRPDTECLVEAALKKLTGKPTARVLELGTGSGAIALAIASERLRDTVVATDISSAALEVALENHRRLTQDQVPLAPITWLLSNWFDQISELPFDLIVSNPPYIDRQDPHIERSVASFEPELALFAHNEGLHAIESIVARAPEFLIPGGHLVLEHGWKQHEAVQTLLAQHGFSQIVSLKDHGDHYRVTAGTLGAPSS